MVSISKSGGPPWEKRSAIPPPPVARNQQATPADRKRQLAQLAEMGVAIPEDFRREMAMPGDWQTASERVVYENDFLKKEEGSEDVKLGGLNIGVRKRKFEGQEEEEEAGESVIRKGWGSTIRTYPGAGEDNDLNMLLTNTKMVLRGIAEPQTLGSQRLSTTEPGDSQTMSKESKPNSDLPAIKKEESTGSDEVPGTNPKKTAIVEPYPDSLKQEENPPDSGVVFKKRKAKPIRQK